MKKYCPIRKIGRCKLWFDYQDALLALDIERERSRQNWDETLLLLEKIDRLQALILEAGMDIPHTI